MTEKIDAIRARLEDDSYWNDEGARIAVEDIRTLLSALAQRDAETENLKAVCADITRRGDNALAELDDAKVTIARLQSELKAARDDEYLIWSHEHGAWWRPAESGYTVHVDAAGRYSRGEALAICHDARSGFQFNKPPSEIPVRQSDLSALKRMQTPGDEA